MRRSTIAGILCLAASLLARASGQDTIPVEGLEDREVYADRVAFRIPAAPGFDSTAHLNGEPIPLDLSIQVARPEYYELNIHRRHRVTGAEESRLIRFIVRDSERGNSEWGLPAWVPHPDIPSAAAEFEGARLEIVAPAAFPRGLDIPVIARVEDTAGRRVGVNGAVRSDEWPDFSVRLFRGVGSALSPPAGSAGELSWTARIQALEVNVRTTIEEETNWIPVSGALGASASWGENARIHIADHLTIPDGSTLTVGAGSVIRVAAGIDVIVNGTLAVEGTLERPVVFTPGSRHAHWGGFLLRAATSLAEVRGAIFTGSGANPEWFRQVPDSGHSHRKNQCLFYLSGGARANLTECFIIDNHGQAGHGEDSFLTMTRCLVQRCVTTGQYNHGSLTLKQCALVEFPSANVPFADDDSDALYLTGGAHSLTDCFVGWALDDGIDAGSGDGGSVDIVRCWIESCYHEALAWSKARVAKSLDTVTINCGQGIECGFDDPDVLAERCLSTANVVGARFGDNYDWTYEGFLRVTDSLLLHNRRDVWGRAWDDWTEHLSRMEIRQNFLSAPDPSFPDNALWQPEADAPRLIDFLPTPASMVGVGLASSTETLDRDRLDGGVPVRLSTFTTLPVSVDYTLRSGDADLGGGTLRFLPGETVKDIPLDAPALDSHDVLVVGLRGPVGAEITGRQSVTVIRNPLLIPFDAVWSYLDDGSDQGTAWRRPDFDDRSWPAGAAELGFGDGDETTTVDGGPDGERHGTIYFRGRFDVADPLALDSVLIRLRRDDGAIVYINDTEVFRSNMPAGEVTYNTLASRTDTSESRFFLEEVSAAVLVPGSNLAAVEVHQGSRTSSDISFAMEMIGNTSRTPGVRFLRADANGDGLVNISDGVRILLVLFAGLGSDCRDALDADDSGAVNLTDAIHLLNYLFRKGEPIPRPYPISGSDPTDDDLHCKRRP